MDEVKHTKPGFATQAAQEERLRSFLRIPGIAVFVATLLLLSVFATLEMLAALSSWRAYILQALRLCGGVLFLLAAANLVLDILIAVYGRFRVRFFAWTGWIFLCIFGLATLGLTVFFEKIARGFAG